MAVPRRQQEGGRAVLTVRKLWCLALVTAGLTLAASVGAAPAGYVDAALAQSDEECPRWEEVVVGEDEDGNVLIETRLVTECRQDGDDGSSAGNETCSLQGVGPVDCVHPVYGWWSQSAGCYVSLANPQPPPGDEDWGDNDPADGAVYLFACPLPAGGFAIDPRFLEEAPGVPSVAQLVQEAIGSLPIVAPQIGIAPDPSGTGLVGLPVWMWTEDTDATWGTLTTTVSVPGLAVTASATATQIEWDMGDGNTVVCDGPGTPYSAEYGSEESPDCGHVYAAPSRDQPEGRYAITATTTWHVDWWVEPQGDGAEGEEGFFPDSSTSVQINELQVVTS
jgi:hypothetical protein